MKFNRKFKQSFKRTKNRQKSIVKTINNIFYKIGWGSYSIAIYDKVERKLYYFKNDRTDITFYKNHKYIYITTEDDNKLFLTILREKFEEVEIEDYDIYVIEENLGIKKVGKIRESRWVGISSNYDKDDKDDEKEESEQAEKSRFYQRESVTEGFTYHPCSFCAEQTNLICNGFYTCELCLGIAEYETKMGIKNNNTKPIRFNSQQQNHLDTGYYLDGDYHNLH